MSEQLSYVEESRSAKLVTGVLLVVYLISIVFFALSGSEGVSGESGGKWWYYLSWIIMWIAAGYVLYLVVGALREGRFPSSGAIVPVRTRQLKGRVVKAVCVLAIVASIILLGIPLGWKYQNDRMQATIERMHELGIQLP